MNSKIPKITKAIIPVAGLGTRFLPWSKNIPKEMLPILNKPTIQYIVEEAVASGIKEILLITSDAKEALVDHFDRNMFLEQSLISKNKFSQVEELRSISKLARLYTIRQYEPKGLGHAVLQARSFVGNEPFVLLLGDDVTYVSGKTKPVTAQMIEIYEKTKGSSVLGVQEVEKSLVSKYGIVKLGKKMDNKTFLLDSVIEKPSIKQAPSNFAICGRYILDPTIFKFLEERNIDLATNEIQITDSILKLSKEKPIYVYNYEAKRYDMGSLSGFLEANLEYGLRDNDLRPQIISLLEKETKSSKIYKTPSVKTVKKK